MSAPRRARTLRWIVGAADGATVADVLARMKVDAAEVTRGNVFVGRRRVVAATEPVRIGDEVRATPDRGEARPPPRVLFERRGVVAALKPAGVPTIPDAQRGESFVADVARALGRPPSALHPTSRLDRAVSGVVFFALDDAARAALSAAREEGRYHRRYVALARGALASPRGTWDAPIGRARDPRHRAARGADAAPAQTHYVQIANMQDALMLAVAPVTGRTHQIRVHASDAGAPLLGDATYGGPARVVSPRGAAVTVPRIALHCAWVHVDGTPWAAEAEIPGDLDELWASLGGDRAMWKVATACPVP